MATVRMELWHHATRTGDVWLQSDMRGVRWTSPIAQQQLRLRAMAYAAKTYALTAAMKKKLVIMASEVQRRMRSSAEREDVKQSQPAQAEEPVRGNRSSCVQGRTVTLG